MTSTNEEAKVLRTDTRGRVRTPVERREALLDEFERSSMSAMAFAKLTGINYAIPRLRDQLAKEATQSERAAQKCFGRRGGHGVSEGDEQADAPL